MWDAWLARGLEADVEVYGAPECLHHYVRSSEDVMSILASQSLWATEVRGLQDDTEFDHGLPTCLAALDQIREPRLREHVEIIGGGLQERFRHETFVTCFSTALDLKSQWNEYADSQHGFAISVDTLVLSALDAPLGLRLLPVEYGPAAQELRARRAVVRAVEDLSAVAEPRESVAFVWAVQSRFTLLAAELFYMCTSFKSERWRDEHEWRLVYTRQDVDNNSLPVLTRISRGRQVNYVEIDLRRRYTQQALLSFAAVCGGPKTPRSAADLVRRHLWEFEPGVRWHEQSPF